MNSPIKFRYFLLVNAVIVAFLSGCASTSRITNLSPAYLYSKPTVSSYKSPEADISRYRTFSVFPQSLISEQTKMNEILEKQILFFIRNQLEAKGYKFVELNQQPGFLATIDVSSEYATSYVPPHSITLPQWVPGQRITTRGSSSGTFNYKTYGSYSSYGWGSYSGSSTSTTYVPGYMTTQTYTRPGYTIGHYYPAAGISIYDAKTLERMWLGTGTGTSDNADVRISSQFVISHILAEFPNASAPYGWHPTQGVIGIILGIFTNDGNNYVPTIIRVAKQSPAHKVGLRNYDMILAIDGVQVVNKPLSEIMNLIGGRPGTTTRLDIWRTGQKISFEVTSTSRGNIEW